MNAANVILELREKLDMVAGDAPAATTDKPAGAALGVIEQDALSALINLGCQRAAADAAVRKAKEQGVGEEFEPLFRRALELVR